MNEYEQKQEARRERLQKLAEKAKAESRAHYETSRKLTENIPMGQPILVGHHSEKSHRKALDRSWNHLGKSVKAQEKAEYYTQKADSVGSGGISSDDPEAIEKLQKELYRHVNGQEYMKSINAKYRKAKGDIEAMDVNEKIKSTLRGSKKNYYLGEARFVPYERFALSNNNAAIKRIQARIDSLRARETEKNREPQRIVGTGFVIEECPEDNRIRITFDNRTSKEVFSQMRSFGFVYSRTNQAFQRQLNGNGRYAAGRALAYLKNHGDYQG